MKMAQSVPKRQHIKFRSQGIAQKREYNIQNKAKVCNQVDRQCTYRRTCNIQMRWRDICCHRKAASITHSERMSTAWVIQHVACTFRTILSLSSVACLVLSYCSAILFDIFSQTAQFSEKCIEHKMWILILVNDQLDALFSMDLFHASTCLEQQVSIIRRNKLFQYIIWYNILQWATVLCAGRHIRQSPTRIYSTRRCIDTIWSSWWWTLVALNT